MNTQDGVEIKPFMKVWLYPANNQWGGTIKSAARVSIGDGDWYEIVPVVTQVKRGYGRQKGE